jgi:hypothetical protein
MDDTTLLIMIRLGMQEEENSKVTLAKLESYFKALEKEANNLKKAIQVALDHDEDAGLLQAALEDVEAAMSDATVQAAKLNREMKQSQWDNLKKIGGDLEQVGDKISNIGRGMSIMGVGILAGVYSSIQKFNEANPLDPTAQRWLEAQEEIERSFLRIGGVAADRLLPLIEKLADLAEKTADFVEKNPEVIDALVGAASFMAVAGGGLQLAGGAMKLGGMGLDIIAKVGAGGTAAAGTGTGITGGAAAATAGSAALLVAAPIAGGIIAKEVGNAFQRAMGQEESSWSDIGETAKQAVMLPSKLALMGLVDLGVISEETGAKVNAFQNELFGMGDAAEEAASSAEDASRRIVLTAEEAQKAQEAEAKATEEAARAAEKKAQAEKQLAEAYEDFQRENAEAARQYASDRRNVLRDANDAEKQAQRAHEQTILSIEEDYARQRADLLNDYKADDAQAAQQYQQERAQAVRDGGEEIAQIERDHQKRLAELAQSHNDRMGDLAASRDALGIKDELRDYERSRRGEEDNANEEIAQRRQDIATRLRDLAQSYAAERAQRMQALQQALADAAEQKKIQLAEEQSKFAEEQKQRKEETSRRLRDLQEQFNEETRRRREAFLRSIRDLDTALNGETQRKRQYYALMLKDAEAFMRQWRSEMYPSKTSKTTTPIHDYSGYAYTGTYAMAQDGQPEFVLSGAATKAAEQMVGGQLNEQALLSGLAGRRGGMQYIDHSSYAGMTVADVRRVREISEQSAMRVMEKVLSRN